MTKRKIIIAPLNWGLGHATRCVPIINLLLKNQFTPIIASDGDVLALLQNEYPDLEFIELPSYGISYAKNLKTSLLLQMPKIIKAVRVEKKVIKKYIENNLGVIGIISDNRFGVRSSKVPSVYITHQINVFSGLTTVISSKIHQKIIKKFDECWVPDSDDSGLSGLLSKTENNVLKIKYIGVLSRFKKENLPIINKVLIVLSGIESQRVLLEKKMLDEFKSYQGAVVLVQGKIVAEQTVKVENGIKIYNFLLSSDLEREINQSELIVCRSGYSSIMDLAVLAKKAFLIPTPNQPEQEYLAKHLKVKGFAPYCKQQDFNIQLLNEVKLYCGLMTQGNSFDSSLFSLFERE